MKALPGIKKLHHFRFESAHLGKVFMKEFIDSTEQIRSLMKDNWVPDPNELPDIIPAKGLSTERQWYLYDQIRQFCPDSRKDLTCPEPSVPKPCSRSGTPLPTMEIDTDVVSSPTKKQRTCGICREPGHNKRSCPNKEL